MRLHYFRAGEPVRAEEVPAAVASQLQAVAVGRREMGASFAVSGATPDGHPLSTLYSLVVSRDEADAAKESLPPPARQA